MDASAPAAASVLAAVSPGGGVAVVVEGVVVVDGVVAASGAVVVVALGSVIGCSGGLAVVVDGVVVVVESVVVVLCGLLPVRRARVSPPLRVVERVVVDCVVLGVVVVFDGAVVVVVDCGVVAVVPLAEVPVVEPVVDWASAGAAIRALASRAYFNIDILLVVTGSERSRARRDPFPREWLLNNAQMGSMAPHRHELAGCAALTVARFAAVPLFFRDEALRTFRIDPP